MILLAGTHQVDKADLEFKDINLPHRLSTVTPDLNICTNPLRISYMHINVSWSYSLLLLLIPPTSIPPPYFMSFFFFLNNQLNPSCAAHILTGVGSSWSTYWPTRRTPLKKTTTHIPEGSPLAPQWWGILSPSPLHVGMLIGLIVCRQPQGMGAQDCNSPAFLTSAYNLTVLPSPFLGWSPRAQGDFLKEEHSTMTSLEQERLMGEIKMR